MKLKLCLLAVIFVVLSGCASTPTPTPSSPYIAINQPYFDTHEVSYGSVEVNVTSTNEEKATKAGYMSSEEVSSYLKDKITKDIKAHNLYDAVGLSVRINLKLDRAYHFAVSSNMAGWNYLAKVEVLKGQEVLASYHEKANLINTGFVAVFKDMFVSNSDNEKLYVDKAAEDILANLPQWQ
ncbi:hypothetical protein [Marinomonas sp. THO17]|uniref:hypothetical protein n=1 Tax=Marinomonas sp. THO17 TaxID=3149048 RepID=UPI00336BB06C